MPDASTPSPAETLLARRLAHNDGWYDEDDGLVLHDENGQPFAPGDHACGDAS